MIFGWTYETDAYSGQTNLEGAILESGKSALLGKDYSPDLSTPSTRLMLYEETRHSNKKKLSGSPGFYSALRKLSYPTRHLLENTERI
jgi:hypothetical protein